MNWNLTFAKHMQVHSVTFHSMDHAILLLPLNPYPLIRIRHILNPELV